MTPLRARDNLPRCIRSATVCVVDILHERVPLRVAVEDGGVIAELDAEPGASTKAADLSALGGDARA